MSMVLIARRHSMGSDLDQPFAVTSSTSAVSYREAWEQGDALYAIQNVPVNVSWQTLIAELEGFAEAENADTGETPKTGTNAWLVWADRGFEDGGHCPGGVPLFARTMSIYTDHRTAHAAARHIERFAQYGGEPGMWPKYVSVVTKLPVLGGDDELPR